MMARRKKICYIYGKHTINIMKPSNPSKSVFLAVKVIPNAPTDQIEEWDGERLRIRIHGVPEKGKVNQRLLEFLADQLDIAKSNLSLQSGETARIKRIRIEGKSQEELQAFLNTFRRSS